MNKHANLLRSSASQPHTTIKNTAWEMMPIMQMLVGCGVNEFFFGYGFIGWFVRHFSFFLFVFVFCLDRAKKYNTPTVSWVMADEK